MTLAGAADCERAAIRAYLLGADDESAQQWEAAFRAALTAGAMAEAARYAFWLGLSLMMRGLEAPAGGWFTRAEELSTRVGRECPASGYVLIPRILAGLADDPQGARDMAVVATEVGVRCGDADLRALGTLAHGQALIAMGEPAAGIARLDAAMVAATADELGPIVTGIVYCAVILECMDLYDLRRAAEWTNALAAWCDSLPGMVPFRGQCLVHRSQLEQAEGDWPAAVSSAESACRRLADPPQVALGFAYYQRGELQRLLGDFEEAEESYRRARRGGRDPVPGLALLQLYRGDGATAATTIRRALQERSNPAERTGVLFAVVEICRAIGDFTTARTAADELDELALRSPSTFLQAMAAHANGSVRLDQGDVPGALAELRAAARTWQTLHMPYEAAKTAVLIGQACAALGDGAGAVLEFDSAAEVFTRLGAAPDVDRVRSLSAGLAQRPQAVSTTALSTREREVLLHLTAGRTNRQIAEILRVSTHTVARHVEHIYAKLGVTNRTAATAYAYEHHLV
ncbi:LuxR C-terminal-related transcriptional regulator [Mycobacterium sp. NPDC048908]|uniref:helix-turn-helix transcriptional regulator n=1 Tax=Mycobacterium sp. NPDC048908 TaxID=3364292 RepID=UPI003715DA62